MLKKTITFVDLEGQSLTEDFYFHISKAELARLEAVTEGGYGDKLREIAASNNGEKIMEVFTDVIRMSYGTKKADGKGFHKSEEQTNDFLETDAFSELFFELVTDPVSLAGFMQGILPGDIEIDASQLELGAQEIEDVALPGNDAPDAPEVLEVPETQPVPEIANVQIPDTTASALTEEQLRNMSQDELIAYYESRRGL